MTGLDTPSFGQQRLWFVDRMEPGSALYNVPVAVLRPVFEERAGEPVLLVACAGLLSRYRGQDDVVIRPAVGGRPSPETEHLIGLFVNTMPPRVPVAGNPTFRELPSRVCDVTLDGLGYAGTPFERVVETVAPQRDLGHAPIYQAQLNRQSTPPLRLPGVTPAEPELVHTRTATVDLTFRFAGRDGRLGADLEYSFDLFDPDTAERRIAHLPAFLPAAATDPEVPVALCLERSAALVDAATRSRPAGLLGRLAGRPGERAGLARRRLRRRQGRVPGAHSGGPDRSSAAQCAGASLRATQLAVRTG